MRVAFGSDERTLLTDAVRADLGARGHRWPWRWGRSPTTTRRLPSSGPRWATTWVGWSRAAPTPQCSSAGPVPVHDRSQQGAYARAAPAPTATASGARRWNDANVLVMGLRLTSPARWERCSTPGSLLPDPSEAANVAGSRSDERSAGSALRELHEVPARVVHERHPLLHAGGPERPVVVAVDERRLVRDLDACAAQLQHAAPRSSTT